MRKKIIIAILLTVVVIAVSLGIISYIAVQESIGHTLQHKLELSQIVAKNIDLTLSSSYNRLYDISLSGAIDLTDGDWTVEREALKKAFDYSIFTDGLFILNKRGKVIYNYPPQLLSQVNFLTLPKANLALTEGRPFISDIHTIEPSRKKVVYIIVPLRNSNGIVEGSVGGEIDPSAQGFNEIIRSFPAEKNTYMEIVDSNGFVIASSDAKRVFKDQSEGHSEFLGKLITGKKPVITKCHRCHEAGLAEPFRSDRSTDIMAYAPLEVAPWGVSMIQPEKDILSPVERMERSFLVVGLVFVCIALIVAVGMSRSIVRPVHELIEASRKIAEGDMSKAIAFGGTDEIGELSSSFEVMRLKLADSLEDLQRSNAGLEMKVAERTQQINASRREIKDLLKKVITSQEEERMRIAREFHDVIMQDLAAALMKIDLFRQYPENITAEKIDGIKMIIEKNIDEVYRIIKNLRPTVLDDLGFEAAVRWLIDNHLESRGIHCHTTISGAISEVTFEPHMEIELFRIIQEAINNIARHSMAENVFVLMEVKNGDLAIDIEDDGCGFDSEKVFLDPDSARGLGLMGMRERASFLNCKFKICSTSGGGTRVSLKVPLDKEVAKYV
jgi:signal transduction histidine kinase